MDAKVVLDEVQPGLSKRVLAASASKQLCSRTTHTYEQWIAQYLAFNGLSNPFRLGAKNVKEFLKHISRKLSPSRARLNQAKSALEFFYAQVLKRPLSRKDLELPTT